MASLWSLALALTILAPSACGKTVFETGVTANFNNGDFGFTSEGGDDPRRRKGELSVEVDTDAQTAVIMSPYVTLMQECDYRITFKAYAERNRDGYAEILSRPGTTKPTNQGLGFRYTTKKQEFSFQVAGTNLPKSGQYYRFTAQAKKNATFYFDDISIRPTGMFGVCREAKFDNGVAGWTIEASSGAAATISTKDKRLVAEVTAVATTPLLRHVQVKSPAFRLVKEGVYIIKARVWTDTTAAQIQPEIRLTANYATFIPIKAPTKYNVPTKRSHRFEWETLSPISMTGNYNFYLQFGRVTGKYYIDDIEIYMKR